MNLDDTSGDVYAKYKVPYQPAWMFIATDGTVTPRIGSLGLSAVSELIQGMK